MGTGIISLQDREDWLKASETFRELHRKADTGTLLTEDDWRSLDELVKEVLPGFQQFIAAKEYVMSQNERRVCLLLRLHVKPLCICHLLGVSAAAVTMMSKSLLQKLFGRKGASRELSERLCENE